MGRYIYDSVNQQEIPVYGSGGHTIKNSSGTSMTQRKNLKFANATVTDDAQNDTTVITTAGGDPTNFVGTLAEWEALTQSEKDEYDSVDLTDDYNDVTDDIEVLEQNIGNLSNLDTTVKTDLVSAINEVNAKPSGGGSVMIAGTEETSTASQAYLPEQYLIYEDTLYKVIESITLGDTLEEDENIEAVTLGGEITSHLSVNGTGFYFDSHDGVFGYNTSPSRGADTFVPFSSGGYDFFIFGYNVASYRGIAALCDLRDDSKDANFFDKSSGGTSITVNEVTVTGHYVSPTTGQSGGYALSITSTKSATLTFRPKSENTWSTYELSANTQTQFYTFNKQNTAMNIYMLVKLH